MKSLILAAPGQINFHESAIPVAAPGEYIVRVAACGICGSDMHRWHGHVNAPPWVLGHEAAGWIVGGPRDGAPVAINPTLSCHSCDHCLGGRQHLCRSRQYIGVHRPGAFADMVAVPERNLLPLPGGMDVATAALTEPVAVGYHAVELAARLLHRPLTGCRALVLGGGAIGLVAAMVLRLRGTRIIDMVEPNTLRRQTAAETGFGAVHSSSDGFTTGDFDLVIDAVGLEATRAVSSSVVKAGGVILHLGLSPGANGLDVRRLTHDEIIFTGAICYSPLDFCEALTLLAEGRLGPLDWVERRGMQQGAQAFADIDANRTAAAKLLLVNEDFT